MKRSLARALVVATIAGSTLTGCISPRSFVDPSVPKVAYEDLRKRSEPLRLKVAVEFQRNGTHLPRADAALRDHAERTLRATGLVQPVEAQEVGDISITVNNLGDVGQAAAKGFGTGLTFGLVGSTVMDAYEMTVVMTVNGRQIRRSAVKHALYTAIGNTTLPEGVETVPPGVAFGKVVEQLLLRTLRDMQRSGELSAVQVLPALRRAS